jgi:hypothetical protein
MVYVYPHLAAAKKRAKQLNLPEPKSSQRANKKLYIVYNGKEIHFGARGYSDFLDHGDEARRQRYRARARGSILKTGKLAYKDKNQPSYYAYNILW